MNVILHSNEAKVGKWKLSQVGDQFKFTWVSRLDGQVANHAGKVLSFKTMQDDSRDKKSFYICADSTSEALWDISAFGT
jgi:hypothetical protein